jgi:predicted permease
LRSLINLETFNPGFARDQVLLVSLDSYAASRSRQQVATFYNQLLARVRRLPGVRSVSYSSFTPISGKEVGVNLIVEGYSLKPGETANERFVGVSPDYFSTMGIPLLAGRDFTEQDIHLESRSYQVTDVAILNRTMARRFFGDSNPIGKHLRFVEGANNRPLEIIGVVADSKYNDLRESPLEFFYIPGTHGDLQVRANLATGALSSAVRDVVRSLDPSVAVTGVKTLRASLDESLRPDRLIAALTTILGLLALALTCVGLYGLLAFEVTRRTGEIGVRTALGARPRDIFRLIVGQGLRLTAVGVIVGTFGAVTAGSLFANFLFGVKDTDVLTFLVVSMTLCVAGFLACFIPARRASRVDPMTALRSE